MKSTHLSPPSLRPYNGSSAGVTERSTAIQSLFAELVQVLEQLRENSRGTADDGSVERWEDAEIDINVHDGRFYVRLER